MDYELLNSINSPDDLKSVSEDKIPKLCEEIRNFLIEKVGASGGHLASNLGVTELSVALHRVFNSPEDHIIFDVGHQAYVHKMLTGRKDRFGELRVPGGLSGFTLMRESEHDAFGAGHSSTSLSAALGYAEGDKLAGRSNHTVCVIGDGAYTGGMIHEAINNCKPDLRLIVILNENGMSISTNKGAFASYLSSVRMSGGYRDMKKRTDSILSHIPFIGKPIRALLSFTKNLVKKIVFKSNYFEDLGFYYLGPIDGNDYKKVERALEDAKKLDKCVFIHIKTKKGKGYPEAEEQPEVFHSVQSADASLATFHSEFADELIKLAAEDEKIVAVTAAMGVGTGLRTFEDSYPSRYFDVGIAEEHALTFAAGLAANGYKPFAAIYSTFLQRGYDNIVHDIALQELPVRLIIDRAGISVGDGATHHGIFDVSFLSHIPGMEIIAPASHATLRLSVDYAATSIKPLAIRYPNSSENALVCEHFYKDSQELLDFRCDFEPETAPRNLFITYGSISSSVLAAAKMLKQDGIDVGIILVERIKPYNPLVEFLATVARDRHIVYVEEGIKNGGAAMITKTMLSELVDGNFKFDIAAIDDSFVVPKEPSDIYDFAGLSPNRLAAYFR